MSKDYVLQWRSHDEEKVYEKDPRQPNTLDVKRPRTNDKDTYSILPQIGDS